MSAQATRHHCSLQHSVLCTRGEGAPRRKACGYCGAALVIERGLYGVFVWTGDNRYPPENAVSTHTSRKRADAACDTEAGRAGNHVSRWLYGAEK